jgi:hypothetical protein
VNDNAALDRVELWRARIQSGICDTGAEANCAWSNVASQSVSGTSQSGSIAYAPPAGNWFFGLHAVDASGNWGDEPLPNTAEALSAANPTLYPYAADYAIPAGQNFTFEILANTAGSAVTAVSAYLNFDATKLEVVGIDTNGSVFSLEAENNYDNAAGTVKLTRGQAAPGTNGQNALVARINFRGKAKGTGSVNFQLNSVGAGPSRLVISNGSDILKAVINSAFIIE